MSILAHKNIQNDIQSSLIQSINIQNDENDFSFLY